MEKIKYRDLIMQYLTALEPDQTITTEQVAQYVAERLLLDAAMVKKTVNVNMARLEKEGQDYASNQRDLLQEGENSIWILYSG